MARFPAGRRDGRLRVRRQDAEQRAHLDKRGALARCERRGCDRRERLESVEPGISYDGAIDWRATISFRDRFLGTARKSRRTESVVRPALETSAWKRAH